MVIQPCEQMLLSYMKTEGVWVWEGGAHPTKMRINSNSDDI